MVQKKNEMVRRLIGETPQQPHTLVQRLIEAQRQKLNTITETEQARAQAQRQKLKTITETENQSIKTRENPNSTSFEPEREPE